LAPDEEPLASVEEMAALYLEAVRAVRPRGPYLLGGWSLGGVIAFEMAQRLRRAGEEVALLALVDTWAPLEGSRPGVAGDADLLALLAEDLGYAGPEEELRELREVLRVLPDGERIARFTEWMRGAAPDLPVPDPAEVPRRLAVYRATSRAVAEYGAAPYPGRITVLRASHGPPGDDPRLRWSRLSTEPLEVRTVPGTHHSIVREPGVRALADALLEPLRASAPD
ncbi:MAG TPA: alpha/beta fold hydrolase, partial [Longimicrobiaceae bacterium]